jgi:RNA polymerase sigma-70 factor (ECF subfamily)
MLKAVARTVSRNNSGEELAVLVRRARAGERDALEALIGRYQARIAGFIAMLLGERDVIDDLCQSTFVKMIVALPGLKAAENFESWLFRIARNGCMDHLRSLRWRRLLFVPWTKDHDEIAAPADQRGASRLLRLREVLGDMPPRYRELLVLQQENDWSYEDLARITGSSVSAVRSRLHRAREELRRRMEHED